MFLQSPKEGGVALNIILYYEWKMTENLLDFLGHFYIFIQVYSFYTLSATAFLLSYEKPSSGRATVADERKETRLYFCRDGGE